MNTRVPADLEHATPKINAPQRGKSSHCYNQEPENQGSGLTLWHRPSHSGQYLMPSWAIIECLGSMSNIYTAIPLHGNGDKLLTVSFLWPQSNLINGIHRNTWAIIFIHRNVWAMQKSRIEFNVYECKIPQLGFAVYIVSRQAFVSIKGREMLKLSLSVRMCEWLESSCMVMGPHRNCVI